ncbi:sensor histidine kinase, partial [Pedobacter sp.]
MSVPAVKENFINFIVKLVLVITLIGCGVVLLFYQNNSAKYIAQKQQRIASLIDLKGALEQTDYAYLKIKNGDSTLGDSLKINLKILSEKKKALLLFTQQNELYKNNALAAKSSLEEEESFYTAQLNSFSSGSDNVQIDSSNKIGRTQPLLTALINLERDELSQKISQNDSLYTILGYLVVGVGALVLLMVVIINNRLQKGLQKQVTHERDIYNAKLIAQAANNAKTEYLGMISHEIRTPMNGVLGMSNLLLQGSLNTEQKEYAKTIHDSAETLLRIVNDILDFSKIEGGKLHLDKSSVNIRELIEDAFAHFPKSKEGVDISYKVDPNVPNSIYCDPKRLKQILLNFLGNAIKFTEKGSVVLECTLIDKDGHGAMRLGFVIKDTGIGIAESPIKSL